MVKRDWYVRNLNSPKSMGIQEIAGLRVWYGGDMDEYLESMEEDMGAVGESLVRA